MLGGFFFKKKKDYLLVGFFLRRLFSSLEIIMNMVIPQVKSKEESRTLQRLGWLSQGHQTWLNPNNL